MSKLEDIQYILSSNFIAPDKTRLRENIGAFVMDIPIKNDGLSYLSYKYDKELTGYRGGLFPFFAQNKGVQRICDYILFTEKGNRFYALMFELKRGKDNTRKQLEASKCLVNYIISTVIRVKKVPIEPQLRCISISEFKRIKKGTREKPVQYENGFTEFKGNTFRLKSYLV